MKVPKYIKQALQKRADAASEFIKYDTAIVLFLEGHNLLSIIPKDHIQTGCESLVNPYSSSAVILEILENSEVDSNG